PARPPPQPQPHRRRGRPRRPRRVRRARTHRAQRRRCPGTPFPPPSPQHPGAAHMTTHTDPRRTLLAGLLGGIAFVLGTFLTFAQLGGSREGETGLLFDPDTQHEKVITVWKELEPLPRIVEQPPVVLAGMIGFAVAHAALYRWIAAGWPASTR